MKIFTIRHTKTDEIICIAARTTNHAAQVFVSFLLARTGSAPGEFHVERGAPPGYVDNFFVRNIAKGDNAGVIVRQTDGSMLFDPATGE